MKAFITTFIVSLSLVLTGCGPANIHKIKQELNTVTGSADAAVKLNHGNYTSGLYGPVGSDAAVATRVKVATVLNDVLVPIAVAVDVSKTMTSANFTGSKQQIVQLLQAAVAKAIQHPTGNQNIDLALQAIAVALNTALTVIQAFTSADIRFASPRNMFNEQATALNNIIQINQEALCL